MKKILLKNLNLNEIDQLSREQLKSVLGGTYPITTFNIGERCSTDIDCKHFDLVLGKVFGICGEGPNDKCICNFLGYTFENVTCSSK